MAYGQRKAKQRQGGKGKPPKRKRSGLTDKKGQRGARKKRAEHNEIKRMPAKKLKSSWVPATLQEQKVARVVEALKSTEDRQGRSKSKYEIIMLLMVVLMLYIFHCDGTLLQLAEEKRPTMSRFYNVAARMTGVGKDTARASWNMMWHDSASENELLIRVADDIKRGRGSPDYPLQDARLLQPEHHDAIDAYIAECHSVKGGRVTLQNLQLHLAEKFTSPDDPTEPFTVSCDVLRYCLVFQLGYHFGKVKLAKKGPGAARPGQVRSYLKKLDEALQLEREEKAVLVYFDEVSERTDNDMLLSLIHLLRFALQLHSS